MVRVPPSGTWERRRADLYGLAEDWLGPAEWPTTRGRSPRAPLPGGFGPATLAEIANCAGLPAGELEPGWRLRLRRFPAEDGDELVDLPRAPLPDPDTPAPVRFLPTWDATLLVHARRAVILPEDHRPRVFHERSRSRCRPSSSTAPSRARGATTTARCGFDPFERLDRATRRALREEGERMAALHA